MSNRPRHCYFFWFYFSIFFCTLTIIDCYLYSSFVCRIRFLSRFLLFFLAFIFSHLYFLSSPFNLLTFLLCPRRCYFCLSIFRVSFLPLLRIHYYSCSYSICYIRFAGHSVLLSFHVIYSYFLFVLFHQPLLFRLPLLDLSVISFLLVLAAVLSVPLTSTISSFADSHFLFLYSL